MRWWHFCLVCFSCCLLPSLHAQEILYYGNSSVSVLIKVQPPSLFFWNYIVCQEPFLYLSGDWSVWGLSDYNQFCQDFLKFPNVSAAFCKHWTSDHVLQNPTHSVAYRFGIKGQLPSPFIAFLNKTFIELILKEKCIREEWKNNIRLEGWW